MIRGATAGGRRVLATAVVAGAASGVVTWWASGRTWGRASLVAETGARVAVTVTGRSVEPAIAALGLALLVLAGAIVATRGWLRRLVGLVVVVLGGAVIGIAATSGSDVAAALRQRAFGVAAASVSGGLSGWAVLCIVAAVLAVAVGAATVGWGARWPALGAKYEPPSAPPTRPDPDPTMSADAAWAALDRGEDPTA